MFFMLAGAGLLALRVVLARPVPEVISDRSLVVGSAAGLLTFLAGNFLGAYVLWR